MTTKRSEAKPWV